MAEAFRSWLSRAATKEQPESKPSLSKLVEPIRERQRADRVETKTTAIGDLYPGLPFDCPVVSTQPLASLTSWLNQLQGRKPTPRFNQPGMGANVFPSCMRVQAEDRIFPR